MAEMRNFKYLPARVADQVRGLALTSRRPMQGNIQGLHRSPDFGASVEFAEYRAYQPGDAPNLIDWSVFAKTERYMIRRFQDETNLRAGRPAHAPSLTTPARSPPASFTSW